MIFVQKWAKCNDECNSCYSLNVTKFDLMNYTLGQAAKATGKSKTTIQRAITKGRISASRSDNGAYQIDPSELHRVFPSVTIDTVAPLAQSNNERPLDETPVLRAKIELLERQLDEIREDRNAWKQQATALLPAPRRRSWWPWSK